MTTSGDLYTEDEGPHWKANLNQPIVLTPLYELGNEANFSRCFRQLEAAGVSQKDVNKFAFQCGYHNMEGTHQGRAVESAAEDCGYEVRWEHEKEEDGQ